MKKGVLIKVYVVKGFSLYIYSLVLFVRSNVQKHWKRKNKQNKHISNMQVIIKESLHY